MLSKDVSKDILLIMKSNLTMINKFYDIFVIYYISTDVRNCEKHLTNI